MFRPVQSNVNFPALEADVLRFWKETRIYEQSLAQRAGAPKFVFYEGPPTANGLPHPGHCLTRAIKDLFPRYRTMRGYLCERKAGWDTHGLPVEVEVCKELGIHSKEEIEAYGVEPFIHKCQQSVWRYMQEWERLTERLGFWIHLDEAYVTYHQSYVESVWCVARRTCSTAGCSIRGTRSSGGGPKGARPCRPAKSAKAIAKWPIRACMCAFRCLDERRPASRIRILLVWTTTPWTLPSNQFAAVHPGLGLRGCRRSPRLDRRADHRRGAGRNDRRQSRNAS